MVSIHSWPQAIVHVDGDGFFASCEQAIHPEYRGKPVVTGKERGIAASFSYEAKERGVQRAMRLDEVKKVCPDCIIVPSDYETYSLISKRMFEIMREFTPVIEEYSIDEGFADVTGLRRPLNMSYGKIAQSMKIKIEGSLGISVSVGASLNKNLAKLASGYDKPSGLTILPGKSVDKFLSNIPLHNVWGIGPNTSSYLRKFGVKTARDLAQRGEEFVKKRLTKPGIEIWQELNGRYIYKVDPRLKQKYKSISKTKTFTPPSSNKGFVWAQLVKNLEAACIKARRYGLVALRVVVLLKKQDFSMRGVEIRLNRGSSYDLEIIPHVKRVFEKIFSTQHLYRSTGIILSHLRVEAKIQYSLFDDPVKVEKIKSVFVTIDELDGRYGKYTVQLASALPAKLMVRHQGARGDMPARMKVRIRGENRRQRLKLPYFFAEV